MLKTWKKAVSLVLVFAMSMMVCVPAFAASTSGIKGHIVFQGKGSEGSLSPRSNNIGTVSVSYQKNEDGSYTIFQYNDGSIIEEHTTTPGSGTVCHKFYHKDGTVTANTEVVQENPDSGFRLMENNDPYSDLSSGASTRPLGYMNYRNPWTQDVFSISCYVIDEQHINQPYTFYKSTAKTLANWISTLLSVWAFYANPAELMSKVVGGLSAYGVLNGALTGVLTVAITKTVRCTYYNQELHGDPTQPAGRGKHARLDGTYCYLDVSGNTEIKTEGYTVRDWGNNAMGRQMMYKVFSIDEHPTSWTNLDL